MKELELTPQDPIDPKGIEGEGQEIDPTGNLGDGDDDLSGKGEGSGEGGEGGKPSGEEDLSKEGAKKVDEGSPSVEELLSQRDSEIGELRQLLREQKRAIDNLRNKVDSSENLLDKAGFVSDEDKAAAVEQQKALALKERELETVLEMTRLNPKYEDVDSVVSQANFDDMVEAMAKTYSEKNAVSIPEATLTVEGYIWGKTNPYRYMYDLIKNNHPKYVKAKESLEVAAKAAGAPTSISEIDGGVGPTGVGWTSTKIDALPEDELHKVPTDIYSRYLRNELK
ncbi:MAG: hypothetical protein EHM49_01415 [Deltaproteobacteria bacterium]|nr:MAG: hypothetical protein EHM49_01415 [Deltaproteobacteria bacterium]